MIKRREKFISAAMLIAVYLLARSAGAGVISYTPTEYTVFAGGDVDVGIGNTGGSHIGRMVGAGGDVTFATDVIVSDVGEYSGSDLADDDVTIADSSYITGRVDAEVGNYSQTASLYAAAVVVVLTNADVSGNVHDVHHNRANIGTGSEVWDNVQYSGKLTNSYMLHLDCTADSRIAPGTYRELNLIARASY